MSYDTIIGIDPGVSGAITYISRSGNKYDSPKCVKMPTENRDLQDYLRYLKDISDSPIVFIEAVAMRPQDQHVPGKAYRITTMLRNFERVKAAVVSVDMPYVEIYPQTWQSRLGLKEGLKEISKDDHARRKRYFIKHANTLTPVKAVGWNADSILIAICAGWLLDNLPGWVQERLKNNPINLFR